MTYPLRFACALLFVGSVAYSQGANDTAHQSGWVTVGIGTSHFGPAYYFNFSYARGHGMVAIRYLKADEFGFNVEGHYDEPRLTLREAGFLFGGITRQDILALSLAAGIGYVRAVDRGARIGGREYERRDISTLGVPFEFTFRFEFGIFAVGGSWYGNINPEQSNSGALLQLSFGSF